MTFHRWTLAVGAANSLAVLSGTRHKVKRIRVTRTFSVWEVSPL